MKTSTPFWKKRSRPLLLALALSVAVTGCARPYILEDLGMILTAGYDLADDGRLLVTFTLPSIGEETGESRTLALTSKGSLSKEARENAGLSTDRQVVSGQMRVVVISEMLARKGCWHLLDTLMRDVNVTKTLVLCVSDGPAADLLKSKVPTRPSSGRYLYELLRKSQKNYAVPKTSIQDFERMYHDEGADPMIPYVRLMNKTTIMAAGTALFRNDKFVGSLSPEETKMMLLLGGKGEGGDIKQSLHTKGQDGKEDQVMLTFVTTKNKCKLELKNGRVHATYNVKVAGQVIEYSGDDDLTDDKVAKGVEKQIQSGLETRMKDLIDQFQHKYHVDPLGLGTKIRAARLYDQPWTYDLWRKSYENAVIDVNFELRIIRTGITR
ncbi:Ger(x)C family spore germination protein [Tumebacillus sp. ITR2]|uniref:Ger(X)C family spore germination protein n=1 Tax=Tumebacillus amylolyticus TaxID=2801339 RepID=A0ABS1J555_9BACL|nr:Ger(x)C family spore germination protein [Tumebacillus amylolyticus]MBL0385411.1 Ger(x)C family spore germination protein [Tumebacillus amylolyticus]